MMMEKSMNKKLTKFYEKTTNKINKLEKKILKLNNKIDALYQQQHYYYVPANCPTYEMNFDNVNYSTQQKYNFSKVSTSFDTRDFYEGRSRIG